MARAYDPDDVAKRRELDQTSAQAADFFTNTWIRMYRNLAEAGVPHPLAEKMIVAYIISCGSNGINFNEGK